MEYSRDRYVSKLLDGRGNGLIKVITGTRRAGKSYILNTLFYRRLVESGVDERNILRFAFDSDDDIDLLDHYFPEEPTRIEQNDGSYRIDSRKFRAFIKDWAHDGAGYILLDEVQFLDNFVGTLNGLLRNGSNDVYVTGSNSRFLSSDIATEFRGRGLVIHVLPLSFSEYMECSDSSPEDAWRDYIETGGIPIVCRMRSREERIRYLETLCDELYLKDIVSRNNIRQRAMLSDVFDIIASTVSSPVNPKKISDTFCTVLGKKISDDTVSKYIGFMEEAFIISKAMRFDVKGRKYIGSQYKLYFEDVGIRNARLGFRQTEESHLMENIVYNELRYRGFNVDIGRVDVNERTDRIDVNGRPIYSVRALEVDFVARLGDMKYYIQCAVNMDSPDKAANEKRPFGPIDDSFTKMIITKNRLNPQRDEKGIITIDLFDFLMNDGMPW